MKLEQGCYNRCPMVYLCLFIAKIHLFEQMKCLILKINNSTLYVFL
ncbi:hypothetical protein CSC02_0103 [Enterobacter hormaechei subsp. hoffmannii]|nr:hypothetical protein CSC02_0103 [Enterobacter hormaechei subsp. hoffmannii]